jgi:hypothetical protein
LILLEIAVAVIVFALAAGSLYEIWVRGRKSEQVGLELAEASQNARAGVDLLSTELRAAGSGVDPSAAGALLVASQYRVTFAVDENGNRRIDRGEVITYFLDPSRSVALADASANPYDFVLRRKVADSGDPLAYPVPGTGEVVAFGLTQRSSDAIRVKDVPLLSYLDAAGAPLIAADGGRYDPAGVFFGKTVRDADLGKRSGSAAASQVRRVVISMVTETREKNPQTGSYDRVRVEASVEPGSRP